MCASLSHCGVHQRKREFSAQKCSSSATIESDQTACVAVCLLAMSVRAFVTGASVLAMCVRAGALASCLHGVVCVCVCVFVRVCVCVCMCMCACVRPCAIKDATGKVDTAYTIDIGSCGWRVSNLSNNEANAASAQMERSCPQRPTAHNLSPIPLPSSS